MGDSKDKIGDSITAANLPVEKVPEKRIHRKQLFGGLKTAHDIHAELAWGNRRCCACNGPPHERLRSICTAADLMKHNPRLAMLLAAEQGGKLNTVATKHGPAVAFSDLVVCRNCAVAAERAAAKGPSWVQVEIDRGPGPDKVIVQA